MSGVDAAILLYFLIGVWIGWCAHSVLLQLAYRMGIVEYKGLKPRSHHDN